MTMEFGSRAHRLAVLERLGATCADLARANVVSHVGLGLAHTVLDWAEGRRPRAEEGTDEVLRDIREAIDAVDVCTARLAASCPRDAALLERLADAGDLVLNAHRAAVQP